MSNRPKGQNHAWLICAALVRNREYEPLWLAARFLRHFEQRKPSRGECQRLAAAWLAHYKVREQAPPHMRGRVRCVDCQHWPQRTGWCYATDPPTPDAGNARWRRCDAYRWIGETAQQPQEAPQADPQGDALPAPAPTRRPMRRPLWRICSDLDAEGLLDCVERIGRTPAGDGIAFAADCPADTRWRAYEVLGIATPCEPVHPATDRPSDGAKSAPCASPDPGERQCA